MKKYILAAIALVGAMSVPAVAVEVTGNASLVSQYVWRGIPSSDGKAAVQGGVDATWEPGFYAGAWGSNADNTTDSGIEIDLYGGWAGETGDFNYGVGGTFYTYTDDVAEDFLELNLTGGWKWLSADLAFGEYDSDPSQDYFFASVTGKYKNFYATLGNWDWDSGALEDGSYLEAGYGNNLSVNGTYLFDYNIAYIYSEDELLLPGQGNNTFVLGITRNFGIYSKK